MNIIYLILSSIAFVTGLFFINPKTRASSVNFFIIMVLFTTDYGFLSEYFVINRLYFFEFYFIGVILNAIINKKIPILYILSIIVLISINYYLNEPLENNRSHLNSILLDLKTIYYLILVYIITINNSYNIDKIIFENRYFNYILISKTIIVIFLFNLAFFYNINFGTYQVEDYRYFDSGYAIIIILMIYEFIRKRPRAYIIINILILILLNGSRTYLLLLTILTLLNIKKLLKIYNYKLLVISTLTVIIVSIGLEFTRFGNRENLFMNLVFNYYNRINPALIEISNKLPEIIFGKGIGYLFYIPWAKVYNISEGITYFPQIDNFFLTMFIKYGVVYFIIFLIPVYNYINRIKFKSVKYDLMFVLFGLSLTISLIYSPIFILIFFIFSPFLKKYNYQL